ncbi:uncharacterized protein LOC125769494 [Anopheles funestus]|uniref:uncharacterized protein LOC125769494 n=1 Tax=Anopheles funestus TaxID=62324 RepID=UPI0020C62DD0|nr:uncharacterized protein LOC125769494 [Anopheles funestus]
MENVKRAKKSGMLSKLGKAIREECEREWEAENQPGTSRRLRTPPVSDIPVVFPDVEDSGEEIPSYDDIGVLEDDEFEEEWLEQSFIESDEDEEDQPAYENDDKAQRNEKF